MPAVLAGLPTPAVVLPIGTLYKPGMDDDEVYDAVRGWWKIREEARDENTLVVAVAGGVIRGVFRVHQWVPRRRGDRGWEQDLSGKPKWGFDGEPALDLASMIGRDVSHLFRRGVGQPRDVRAPGLGTS